jgi:hypothetical protein
VVSFREAHEDVRALSQRRHDPPRVQQRGLLSRREAQNAISC